jgi:molybdate-binding protein/DNA-binding transcriptional regulator YhcF (GntR family)
LNNEPLYQQIANSLRGKILAGELADGEQLPTVRELADSWGCAPGTVQRAYNVLSHEGFVEGKAGHGTRVASRDGLGSRVQGSPVALATEVDRFIRDMHAAGYSTDQLERSLWFGLDRLKATPGEAAHSAGYLLGFVGSHDPLIAPLSQELARCEPTYRMQVRFVGSLNSLMALAQGEADVAGCHLWDPETDSYNEPFVRRLFPGRRVALVTLAHRRLGLIVQAGNLQGVRSLKDLGRKGLIFINRQSGAGTRVWLDAQLLRLGLTADQIEGYETVANTHSDVCAAIAGGKAHLGLGIESAAANYGLDFIPLTLERYDLAVDGQRWECAPIQSLFKILLDKDFIQLIESYTGYDTKETGSIRWVI